MLIKCPKCRSVYDLADDLIQPEGLKMRCCECGEIWTAHPEDALKKRKSAQNKDLSKIFERVSKQTETLFEENGGNTTEKIRIVNVTRYKHTVNLILLLIALISIAAILYYMRYEIVRLVPQAEQIYDKMYISSVPYGKNLEFKNISTKEFTENNIAKISISGTIANVGKYTSAVPPIRVDIYDKAGNLLLNTNHYLPLPRLEPGYKLLLNIVVTNPTPYAKSIYLNFADNL